MIWMNLNVQERIECMNSSLTTIINLLNRVYLDPQVVAGQVAQAALESARRQGIKINDGKIEHLIKIMIHIMIIMV